MFHTTPTTSLCYHVNVKIRLKSRFKPNAGVLIAHIHVLLRAETILFAFALFYHFTFDLHSSTLGLCMLGMCSGTAQLMKQL